MENVPTIWNVGNKKVSLISIISLVDFTSTYEQMYAVLVEVVEKVLLLRLIDGGQHILWIYQYPENPHQLNCPTKFRVRVADHLFDYHVQQN